MRPLYIPTTCDVFQAGSLCVILDCTFSMGVCQIGLKNS